jgi:hypothetical protein
MGQERHGNAFTDREQHVELAAIGVAGNMLRESEQIVCRVAHGGHDDNEVVALLSGPHDSLGDPPELRWDDKKHWRDLVLDARRHARHPATGGRASNRLPRPEQRDGESAAALAMPRD